jgi:3-hydroxyisobutyrate dehydrogenase
MGSPPRVGFAGIGNMGWPMARNILNAGFALTVYDVDFERAERFAAEVGGAAADSAAVLGRASDLIVTMLPTGADVAKVVLGSGGEGVLGALQAGAIVVDMSSSDPVGTRELGGRLAEHGIALIDAPVSGLVPKAEAGTLTIMIGTDDERALAAAEPVLKCLGERLIRIGSLGCGHAMKALNNFVAATAFTATAEALIVGKRFGLDPRVMTQVLSVSTGRSFHSDVSFPDHVLTRRFATGFTLGLLAKDVGIADDLSRAVEAKTPLMDLVSMLWAEGRDEVGAAADNSAIMQRWERLNGVIVESAQAADAARK